MHVVISLLTVISYHLEYFQMYYYTTHPRALGESFMKIPAENEIREVDGVYYYYENGIKQIGAGVVELTDAEGETYYIYVKSNGQLATGIYWPTTRNDLLPRGEYDWGTDGKYYPAN